MNIYGGDRVGHNDIRTRLGDFAISPDGEWLAGQASYKVPNPSVPGLFQHFIGLFHLPSKQMTALTDSVEIGSDSVGEGAEGASFSWHPMERTFTG